MARPLSTISKPEQPQVLPPDTSDPKAPNGEADAEFDVDEFATEAEPRPKMATSTQGSLTSTRTSNPREVEQASPVPTGRPKPDIYARVRGQEAEHTLTVGIHEPTADDGERGDVYLVKKHMLPVFEGLVVAAAVVRVPLRARQNRGVPRQIASPRSQERGRPLQGNGAQSCRAGESRVDADVLRPRSEVLPHKAPSRPVPRPRLVERAATKELGAPWYGGRHRQSRSPRGQARHRQAQPMNILDGLPFARIIFADSEYFTAPWRKGPAHLFRGHRVSDRQHLAGGHGRVRRAGPVPRGQADGLISYSIPAEISVFEACRWSRPLPRDRPVRRARVNINGLSCKDLGFPLGEKSGACGRPGAP